MSERIENEATSAPPLRIHHLLAWMTVTAVLMSACLWFERTLRNGPAIENPLTIVSLLLGAVALSAILTLVAFGAHWRRHGYAFPITPGEWVIVTLSISLGQCVAVFFLFLAIFFAIGDDDWFPAYFFVATLALVAGWARLNAAGMSRYADTRAWSIFYLALMVAPGFVMMTILFRGFPTALPLAAVIACVLFAAWRDVRLRAQRPWTHWVGVGAVVWLCTAMIGLSIG